ncbi:MAG: hypothetical protein Q9188_002890 [Gyalolechia gomerana]
MVTPVTTSNFTKFHAKNSSMPNNNNSVFLMIEIRRSFSIPYDPTTVMKDFLASASSITEPDTAKSYTESSNRRIFQGYHHASAEAELVFGRYVRSHNVFDAIRYKGRDGTVVLVAFMLDGKEMFEVQVVETEFKSQNEMMAVEGDVD